MAKIDLKKSSGFPLFTENNLLSSPDLNYSRKKDFNIEDLKSQLLNQDLSYPQEVYSKYFGLDQDDVFKGKKFKVNAFLVPPNLAGIEYIKTRALRSTSNRIFEVWYGGGTLVMQNFDQGEGDTLLVKLKRDVKMIIPSGYAATMVNTRQSLMIVAEIMEFGSRNQAVLDEMHGMAYYVIRKNAKQEIVRNPYYKNPNEYKSVRWEDIVQEYGITLKTPVIKQILRKNDKFKWLFDNTEITL